MAFANTVRLYIDNRVIVPVHVQPGNLSIIEIMTFLSKGLLDYRSIREMSEYQHMGNVSIFYVSADESLAPVA